MRLINTTTIRRLALIAALLLSVTACEQPQDDQTLRVVATTTILGDVVEQIVGGDATVIVLMPIGADPHDFQPSSQQVAKLAEADLIVANGLGLEESLDDVLDSLDPPVLHLAEALSPLPFSGGEPNHADAGHEDGALDPHVWLDPQRMISATSLIAEALTAIEPAVDWAVRAEEYADKIADADRTIQELLGGLENRVLVTNHDALGYFADRYGFEVVGVVIPGGSTLAEPSSSELAELVRIIREHAVGAIFAETTEPTSLAEAVAAEVGDIKVVELFTGSLGGPGSDAETLIGMWTVNARRIEEALG